MKRFNFYEKLAAMKDDLMAIFKFQHAFRRNSTLINIKSSNRNALN